MRLSPSTPVLARPDGSTQVGVAEPLILHGLTEHQRLLLASAETTPLGREALAELGDTGDRLVRCGVLRDEPTAPQGMVAIHSGGRLGIELGSALAAVGVPLGFVDPRPTSDEPSLYPRRALVATCAGGAAWAVRDRHPGAKVSDASDPALTVHLSVGGAARHHTVEWEHDGVPHLLIHADEHGATVGPLVIPGSTPCGRCVALSRTEDDPAWPLLLDQLASRQARVPATLVPGVVATAVRMIVAHLVGAPASGEAWRLTATAAPELAPVSAHRECGCGAWDLDAEPEQGCAPIAPALRLLPDIRPHA